MHLLQVKKYAVAAWMCSSILSCCPAAEPNVQPVVEIEEDVYSFEPANNGAGPMWCSGSTCLVSIGDDVFATGLETIKGAKPLNNCRWTLYSRQSTGWQLLQSDPAGRTREPCPIAAFQDGPLFLSANPTLTERDVYSGSARPEILQFASKTPKAPFQRLLPAWEGRPEFTEHSYRSLAADGPNRELILFQNIGYTHAEWTFLDRTGTWNAQNRLAWPEGKEYPKPGPIRVCYPNVSLNNRAVHFCGVSDIVEPYPEWRAFKKQLTGQEWDYDFRRLFYTWTPDITRESFSPWVEIASRDKTCGWISPGDLWVAADGTAHIVWIERALDERLRTRFFPEARQSIALNYAVVRHGKVVSRRSLVAHEEGKTPSGTPAAPRLHPTPDNRLFLCYYIHGADDSGRAFSENRLVEIRPGEEPAKSVKIPFKKPFTSYFTATVRAGSSPSATLQLLGIRQDTPATISYARVRIF